MSTIQERLIAKGAKEPLAGLAQQAEYTLGLCETFKKDLVEHGIPEAKLASLRETLTEIQTAAGKQTESWSTAQSKTRAEAVAIDNAKAFIHKLWNAAPLALRESGATDLTLNDFAGQGRAERSSPKLVAYLDRVQPHVAKLEAQLKPYFKGESPVAILGNVRSALASADQSQELARAQAPDATAKLNEAKGRLLQHIEDVNRVAAIAFYGRADLYGRFNKDILLRARRSRSGKADPVPEPPPAPSPNPAKPG